MQTQDFEECNDSLPNEAKSGLYKTELCKKFQDTGFCRYNEKCQFAHGLNQLRAFPRHPKYKTEHCKTFWNHGSCPYGTRCRFLHELVGRTDRSNSFDSTSSTISFISPSHTPTMLGNRAHKPRLYVDIPSQSYDLLTSTNDWKPLFTVATSASNNGKVSVFSGDEFSSKQISSFATTPPSIIASSFSEENDAASTLFNVSQTKKIISAFGSPLSVSSSVVRSIGSPFGNKNNGNCSNHPSPIGRSPTIKSTAPLVNIRDPEVQTTDKEDFLSSFTDLAVQK